MRDLWCWVGRIKPQRGGSDGNDVVMCPSVERAAIHVGSGASRLEPTYGCDAFDSPRVPSPRTPTAMIP
jgi:hypothetical protein